MCLVSFFLVLDDIFHRLCESSVNGNYVFLTLLIEEQWLNKRFSPFICEHLSLFCLFIIKYRPLQLPLWLSSSSALLCCDFDFMVSKIVLFIYVFFTMSKAAVMIALSFHYSVFLSTMPVLSSILRWSD